MKKLICIFLSVFLTGCATKRKSVEIEKQKESAEVFLNESKTDKIHTQKVIESSEISMIDFSDFLSRLKIDYSGDNDDVFKFKINKTDTGWEAISEGKGTVSLIQEENQSKSVTDTTKSESIDSLSVSYLINQVDYSSAEESAQKTKEIHKKSNGIQAGGYITLALLSVVVLFLAFLVWRLKLFR